jgi:hypothetical protein
VSGANADGLIEGLYALSLALSLLMRTDWLQVSDQTANQATLGSAAEAAQ